LQRRLKKIRFFVFFFVFLFMLQMLLIFSFFLNFFGFEFFRFGETRLRGKVLRWFANEIKKDLIFSSFFLFCLCFRCFSIFLFVNFCSCCWQKGCRSKYWFLFAVNQNFCKVFFSLVNFILFLDFLSFVFVFLFD